MKDNYHIFEERYDWETVTYRFAAKSERRLSGLGQHRRQKGIAPSIKAGSGEPRRCEATSARSSVRLLEIRVISELAKLYPITSIVYEYVKAKTVKGCSFSPVQVGQKWAIKQLSKIATVITKFGWQTNNLRKHLGLPKQKLNKKEAIPATHAVDGLVLAATQFIDYLPFENSQGRGHYWQEKITVTDAPFFVIPRPPISRRQLHLMIPSKGGVRRKYGGTITRHTLERSWRSSPELAVAKQRRGSPEPVRKGDYVEAEKAGVKYKGWCSGDTAKQISVSNFKWRRLAQFTATKVKLLQRSTGLICKRGNDFSVAS